ncbi:MAG: response regulator [Bdellovibrionia bacterium]
MLFKKRILLIEDNRDDEELTIVALRKGRITNEIDVIRDGEEALNFLFARGQYTERVLPQVVLLDLKLPKVEGLQILKEIRANEMTKLLPVVILTSSREERDLMAGYAGGANSYIVKPVDSDQFMESVRQLGLYWVVLNENLIRA